MSTWAFFKWDKFSNHVEDGHETEYICEKVGSAMGKLELCRHKKESNRPKFLLHLDQWGVCHGPFAPARAYLVEEGFGTDVTCFVHDESLGLHAVLAKELYDGGDVVIDWDNLQEGGKTPNTTGGGHLVIRTSCQ